MKILGLILVAGALALAPNGAGAATMVVETITGSSGDWTYAYTITNGEARPLWYWCVWFASNPSADSVTAGAANWGATNLATHGFFPEEYTAAWGCHVYDSSPGDLAGPNGEPGFFYTYAEDVTSGNPEEYWDGDSWEPLPDPLPAWPDPIYDAIWRGGDYGWGGSGADIQTGYGIPGGGTGGFTVHSDAPDAVTGPKSFSFCTTDYWYSFFDGTDNHLDFEGSGTVIPEPATLALLALGAVGVLIRKKPRR